MTDQQQTQVAGQKRKLLVEFEVIFTLKCTVSEKRVSIEFLAHTESVANTLLQLPPPLQRLGVTGGRRHQHRFSPVWE
jgi:hypothetical protein